MYEAQQGESLRCNSFLYASAQHLHCRKKRRDESAVRRQKSSYFGSAEIIKMVSARRTQSITLSYNTRTRHLSFWGSARIESASIILQLCLHMCEEISWNMEPSWAALPNLTPASQNGRWGVLEPVAAPVVEHGLPSLSLVLRDYDL